MAAGSQNPLRQAMINMMYLVLLALLALNVSAEVLKAFATVHDGIQASNESITQKNESTMGRFEELMENDRERTVKHYKKAQEVRRLTEELSRDIDTLKDYVIQKSGGYLEGDSSKALAGAKNLDIGTRILVEQGNGDELQEDINNTRDSLISILKTYNQDTIQANDINLERVRSQLPLQAKDPPDGPDNKNSWAAANFQMVPVTAAVTLLTKIQNDVKNSESEVLSTLVSQVGSSELSFDKITPIVKTDKSAVSVNEQFEAEIMLGAYSTTQDPVVTVDGEKLEVSRGMATYKTTPSSPGSKKVPFKMKITNPSTGEKQVLKEEIEYSAFNAPAIISPDAMNVLYKGLDNPVTVSVPGYKPNQIRANITKGDLKKKASGNYIATNLPQARKTYINVSIALEGGKTKSIGKKEFRIKPVPKPTPYFGSKASGTISRGEVGIVNAIVASMGDGFAFEGVKYVVSHFRLTYVPKRGNFKEATNNGPRLTSEMKNMLSDPKPGDKIIVDNIEAKGPDGVKNLPSTIVLTVE